MVVNNYNSIDSATTNNGVRNVENTSLMNEQERAELQHAYSIDVEGAAFLSSSTDKKDKNSSLFLSVYAVMGVLFTGVCLGISIGFYMSTQYWGHNPSKYHSQFPTTTSTTTRIEKERSLVSPMITHGTYEPPETPELGLSLSLQKTKESLVYMHHQAAYDMLLTEDDSSQLLLTSSFSEYSNLYFLMSSSWDVQKNQAYCAIATIASTLNSLRPIISIQDPVYQPYSYATQKDVFTDCTKQRVIATDYQTSGKPGIDGLLTPPYGLSLPQVNDFLTCYFNSTSNNYSWKVTTQHVDATHLTVSKMRYDLQQALLSSSSDSNSGGSRILVNYHRAEMGQRGGGHWSPLVAYNAEKDSFLVMDVAKYKYPPVWIPTESLYNSMNTLDSCGTWDYPYAQSYFTLPERMGLTSNIYQQALKKLNCQSTFRGYIILSYTS